VGGDAGEGEFDVMVCDVDPVEDCLLVVAVVVAADDDFYFLELVVAVLELDDLLAAERVDLVVDDGEVVAADAVELLVLLDLEVLAGLLHLRQDLLCLHRQHSLVQLLLLLYLRLTPTLIPHQLLVQHPPPLLLL
jgi:hypothetical protein